MTSMENEEAKRQKFEEQLDVAAELLTHPIHRMLQESDTDPHAIVFALARVAGEFTAAFAMASGYDREEVLSDVAKIMRHSGRNYYKALADAMPAAGQTHEISRLKAALKRGASVYRGRRQ